MSALTVPFLAAALLLMAAGAAKVVAPASTVTAARAVGLPASSTLARSLGVAELVVGVTALTVDGVVPALLVAASFAAFAVVVAVGLVRGGLASCGCFPGERAEPSWLHVALDAVLALTALGAALDSAPTALSAAGHDLPALALLGVATAALAYLVLSHSPRRGEVPARLLEGASR